MRLRRETVARKTARLRAEKAGKQGRSAPPLDNEIRKTNYLAHNAGLGRGPLTVAQKRQLRKRAARTAA